MKPLRVPEEDLTSLNAPLKVSDRIVNSFFYILLCHSVNFALPPFSFVDSLVWSVFREKGFSAASKVFALARKNVDFVLVPFFDFSAEHWSLAILELRSQRITWYDSLGLFNSLNAHHLKALAAYWLQDSSVVSWPVQVETEPRQKNAVDCGVFVCLRALSAVDSSYNFESKECMLQERQFLKEVLLEGIINPLLPSDPCLDPCFDPLITFRDQVFHLSDINPDSLSALHKFSLNWHTRSVRKIRHPFRLRLKDDSKISIKPGEIFDFLNLIKHE